MKKDCVDGYIFLLLGSTVFLLLGVALEHASNTPMLDFKALYYPARCLVQNCDPYMESEVLRIYQAEAGPLPVNVVRNSPIVTRCPYPPSVFSFAVPIAALPLRSAELLWFGLTVGGLIFASFLMWNLGADYAPVLSGALAGFLIANSEGLIILCNAAALVVSLCVGAVWCFIRERFVAAGILCFAISLAIKPHDTGLVWLYFLLAGGTYRKRALQTLLVTVVLCLPGVLWVWHVSPHWIQELHSNIASYSAHGGINDPSLASTGARGIESVISLQTVFSVFRGDPQFYNTATYLVCAPLLLIWVFVTVRSRPSRARTWLALASIAALSMLPIYHRQYDAKLLLLTIPACAMLWVEGGVIRWLALLVNAGALVLTGDLFWAFTFSLLHALHLPATRLSDQILIAVQVFPAPVMLLITAIFYLWVYMRYARIKAEMQDHGESEKMPLAPANASGSLCAGEKNHTLRKGASMQCARATLFSYDS